MGRIARVIERVRGSTWAPIALRAFAVALALFVLAWVGRSAAAGPSSPSSTAAVDRDASAGAERDPARDASLDGGAALTVGSPIVASPTSPAAPAGASRAQASPNDPVFINHASVDELRRLPGVGPKRAEAILVLRQRVGRFQRVEDLLRVKGVGRGAVKKWRPLVRLDTPSAESTLDGGLR